MFNNIFIIMTVLSFLKYKNKKIKFHKFQINKLILNKWYSQLRKLNKNNNKLKKKVMKKYKRKKKKNNLNKN